MIANLNFSVEEITIFSLLVICVAFALWIIRLEIKIKNIPSVKKDRIMGEQISQMQKNLTDLNSFAEQSNKHLDIIDREITKTVQGIETIRFNPFKDGTVGGKQSFASAIVDSNGNGVIFSSLYSRERVSVFAKPINNWQSEYEFSDEEKEVLNKVRNANK